MELSPSQDPAAAPPPGARARRQTRTTRLVSKTSAHETLPTGDEVDVLEERQLQEVVKRTAVVRPRRGEPPPEEEEDEEEGQEGQPEAAPRRSGRAAAAAAARDARLAAEVDAALGGLDRPGGPPGGATAARTEVRVMEEPADTEVIEQEEGASAPGGAGPPVEDTPPDAYAEAHGSLPETQPEPLLALAAEAAPPPARRGARSQPARAAAAEEEEAPSRGAGVLLGGRLAGVAKTALGALLGSAPAAAARPLEEGAAPAPKPRAAPPPATPRRAAAAKAAPPAAAAAKAARRRRRAESYRSYVFKVLRQVHPELGISSKAMDVMHCMMVDLFERLAGEAGALARRARRATLSARDVQAAARLVLGGGELARHAAAEGAKAVARAQQRA